MAVHGVVRALLTRRSHDLPAVVFAGVADDHLRPGGAGDGGDQFGSLEDADAGLVQVGGDDVAGMASAELDALSGDYEATGAADRALGDLLARGRQQRWRSSRTAALQTAAG